MQKETLLTLPYAKPNALKSISELGITWFFLLLNFGAIHHFLASIWLMLPFMALQTGIFARFIVLQHDCGHYALFKKRSLNSLAGMLCSLFTVLSYHFWRDTHAVHHKDNANLDRRPWAGDIDVLTIEEYNQLPKAQKIAYRLQRNGYVIVFLGWLYHVWHYRIKVPSYNKYLMTKRRFIQTQASNGIQILLFALIAYWFSFTFLLFAILMPLLFSYWLGIFFFYIQHNFETSYFFTEEQKLKTGNRMVMKASLEGSSCFLFPPFLNWLTAYVGYHHVHHANPKIPFYNLKTVYESHPEFQKAYVVTFRNAFKQFSYKLYNPTTQRMINWQEYDLLTSSLDEAQRNQG